MNKELFYRIINYLSENNLSNNLPYHNIQHLFDVYNMCLKIVNSDKKMRQYKNTQELFIACLFHDFNHSGGKLTDSENIENAINGVNQFLNSFDNIYDIEQIEYLIKCTEYPYTIKSEELDDLGKIIRDSDMVYLLSDQSVIKLYTNLRNEFNQTLEEFYQNQFKFLNNVSFYTDYCQNLWNKIKSDKLKELEQLTNDNKNRSI